MFGAPGVAYVYLVYGMYHCLNVVTEPHGAPAAVLIRAVEPVAGIDAFRDARRRRSEARGRALAPSPVARLASGPGLVGDAFELTTADTGTDLCDPSASIRLELAPPDARPPRVAATPRIGIDYASEPWLSHPWRFVDADSPSISGRRPR
jgi:DNA-3-methyladenine glycosylase